jgi:hypothetical protein
MKKFYVGAEAVSRAISSGTDAAIMRDTVEEAVEEAKRKLSAEPTRECVVVVQVIRVVRRTPPPFIVDVIE